MHAYLTVAGMDLDWWPGRSFQPAIADYPAPSGATAFRSHR
jgi:hypothetical protein